MTWNHHRGTAPLEAASNLFMSKHQGISLLWDARSLQAFESQPLRELAEHYDLIIIDHPHIGEAVKAGLLLDLNNVGRASSLSTLAAQSVGQSHASYRFGNGHYALAVDAAAPVACFRHGSAPDTLPQTWTELIHLARSGVVGLPLRSPHALMAFFWLANAAGCEIASSDGELMPDDQIAQTLDQFGELTAHVAPECFAMDPITLYDLMSASSQAPAYCPHGYGYISYARRDFREFPLGFTDIVEVNGNGHAGTVLGGTGIAVSALSRHRDIAVDFAFEIASADCQAGLWTQAGGQPGNREAWLDETCNRRTGSFLQNTLATLDGAWVRPRYDGYLAFQAAGSQAISDHLSGGTDRTATVRTLQKLYRESRS